MTNNQNRIYVIMGVSGSGKSAVAAAAARQLSAGFLDGDFLHPRSNILKMAAGEPLNDDDRAPWLAALNDAAFAMQRTNTVSVIVCSALKSTTAIACAPVTATCRSSICTAIFR
jgi:gluconokinase